MTTNDIHEAFDEDGNMYPIQGRLYCQFHNMWLDPPEATHRDHPEFDPVNSGEDCGGAVDVDRVMQFLFGSKVLHVRNQQECGTHDYMPIGEGTWCQCQFVQVWPPKDES